MSQQQICIGDILEPFEELLGERPEPELLTLTEKNGFIAQSQKYNKRVARDDTSDYKVIRRFDIAFNPYLLWAGAIAQNIDWDMALISPLYPTFHVRNGYDPRFIDYLLRGDSLCLRYDTISFGSVPRKRRASVTDFLNLKLPKPPSLSKQQYIADILDRTEALRIKRRAAIAQLDELSQSIFTEMFGDPLKNPMGWSTINLEDICSIITDGEHATPKRTESGIYLLSARNIQNHSLSLDNVDFISKDEYDRISKRIIPQKGDILVSCSGTIGRVAQVKECFKFQLVRSVALLRPETSKVNPTYLEYNFDSIYLKKQIEKSVNQSSQANLFQGKIRKLKIPLPSLEIQNKFAEVAEQLEKIKQSHQQSLLEINNLFDSLTHEAFTGKLFSHQFFDQKIESGVKI